MRTDILNSNLRRSALNRNSADLRKAEFRCAVCGVRINKRKSDERQNHQQRLTRALERLAPAVAAGGGVLEREAGAVSCAGVQDHADNADDGVAEPPAEDIRAPEGGGERGARAGTARLRREGRESAVCAAVLCSAVPEGARERVRGADHKVQEPEVEDTAAEAAGGGEWRCADAEPFVPVRSAEEVDENKEVTGARNF